MAANGALLLGAALALAWQWQIGAALRAEAASLRRQAREVAQLEVENHRLAAAQVSAVELESLRADPDAAARWRKAIADFKAGPAEPGSPLPPGAGPLLRASDWKNVGCATPSAVFETALAAASNGEVDALVKLLLLDVEGPNAVKSFLAELPEAARTGYSPPSRLVALLMAKYLAVDSVQVLDARTQEPPECVFLWVRIKPAVGPDQDVQFTTYRFPDGWKLIVPADAVTNYLETLKGEPATAAAVR
jgi:hypothetical protein